MSYDRFIELLQMLITMTDPEYEESVQNAKAVLKHLGRLGKTSGMMDAYTFRCIHGAYNEFESLLRHRVEFAGVPGDTEGNMAKRRRLSLAVYPHC